MIHRVEIGLREDLKDAAGEKIRARIVRDLGISVSSVRTFDVYTIETDLDEKALAMIVERLFLDPIVQVYAVNRSIADGFDWLIEVGLLPGVTDNVGKTAKETIELFLGRPLGDPGGVYTSKQYRIKGKLMQAEADSIATGLLANTLIQRYEIFERSALEIVGMIAPKVPKVTSKHNPVVEEIDLEVSDRQLEALSAKRVLALELEEMRAIRNYLRDPVVLQKRSRVGLGSKITDVELEAIAQTWSEHCKHKIFNALIDYEDEHGRTIRIEGLFDTFIRAATEKIRTDLGEEDFCLSVFVDNAGVISFNKEWNLVFKVETHNTPSALEPYGGALTGIVGVNRDPFGTGKGARLIFNVDTFCFAPPDYDRPLPSKVLHPRRIYEGVREGVEHGGNKSGIPTVNGSIVFDERFLAKPLVFCGTGGIMPSVLSGEPSHKKAALPGDLVVMTGGRIGKDGIHGATFSSEHLHEGSPATAVQIGDPIVQKKMTDFLLAARDLGLYSSITDNGAGGLSSSVGEMARDPGGCEIELEKAPLKYAGLDPWEILLSEAQERMTLAVPEEKIGRFLAMAERMEVEATVIGRFTDSGVFHVKYDGRTVAYLDMAFFHEGLPRMKLKARWRPPRHPEPDFEEPAELDEVLAKVLSRLNVCSKESVIRRYDHEVQGGSVIKPLVGPGADAPSDAAVLRPLLDSFEGVVVASGICPKYGDIDTYHMTTCAVDEALRNSVAVGGDPDYTAGLDNFCWPDPVQSEKTPDGEQKLAQLVRANMALYDITTAYGLPCISGKDSMKNDYLIGGTKISIPPTVLFSTISRIDDVRRAVTMDAKAPGDLVYVVGKTRQELGGSEYYAMHGFIGNRVPKVEPARAKGLYRRIHQAVREGLVASCHDCSDGGLGVALAEVAFGGGFGMEVDLRKVPADGISRNDHLLFSESQSRFVITVRPEGADRFERLLNGFDFGMVGRVIEGERFLLIGLSGCPVVYTTIGVLKEAWKAPLNF